MTSNPAAEKRRVAWGYEPNTPLCLNCSGYRKAKMQPGAKRDQVLVPATCAKGGFTVESLGCCDKWSSKVTGERLR